LSTELFAEFLILPVRPGLGHLQDVPLFVEEPNNGIVRAFHLILFGNMTVEGRRGPKGSLCTAGILEFLENFFLLRFRDTRLPSCTLPRYEAIDPIQVEGPDHLFYGTFRKIEGGHGLFPGAARDKQNNHRASAMGLPVTCTLGSIQLSQRCILGVRCEIPLGHDSYISTCLIECLDLSTSNGN